MSPAEWAFLGATALWNAILLYTATPQGAVFERRLCGAFKQFLQHSLSASGF